MPNIEQRHTITNNNILPDKTSGRKRENADVFNNSAKKK